MNELDGAIREIVHEYRLDLNMAADRRVFINELWTRGYDIVKRGLTKVADGD